MIDVTKHILLPTKTNTKNFSNKNPLEFHKQNQNLDHPIQLIDQESDSRGEREREKIKYEG